MTGTTYRDETIAGTTVFTGARSHQGYRINKLAMSLTDPGQPRRVPRGRARLHGEVRPDRGRDGPRRAARLDRPGRCRRQHLRAAQDRRAPSGRTCCRSARRCAARRSTTSWRRGPASRARRSRGRADMARIVGGIGCSHAPSIAHSYDRKLQKDPMWAPLYDGWEPAKEWLTQLKPDLMVVVYNDHMNRFFFDAYPSFALGAADRYPQADEGWGTRDFPDFPGHAAFSWHLAQSLVEDEFDPTICQEMSVDHGILSILPLLTETHWPAPIVPIAANVIQHPIPTPRRFFRLGEAIAPRDRELSGGHARAGGLDRRHVAPAARAALRLPQSGVGQRVHGPARERSDLAHQADACALHGARRRRVGRDHHVARDARRARREGAARAPALLRADADRLRPRGVRERADLRAFCSLGETHDGHPHRPAISRFAARRPPDVDRRRMRHRCRRTTGASPPPRTAWPNSTTCSTIRRCATR